MPGLFDSTYLRKYVGTLYQVKRHPLMTTKKASTPAKPKRSRTASTGTDAKLVALTLKVDEKTYVRLCTLGAKLRRWNQDILNDALQEHLRRLGG
jgi:hypothetical protein